MSIDMERFITEEEAEALANTTGLRIIVVKSDSGRISVGFGPARHKRKILQAGINKVYNEFRTAYENKERTGHPPTERPHERFIETVTEKTAGTEAERFVKRYHMMKKMGII